ncbi:MAG: type-F conjugative transfer system protein TraW [Candidatus Paracaedimonas acanthamoebae]|uniref:Type-F conjugative transfer system protein TraW n=1 Tax=Candidatus Paracaedimonas acanthamoebae TaxID=244581 RepID=A0A8J7PSS3_9PROT|nr:type-F conjugative transfer system protein TraW [Candidatus Paracaedimonas acanthamoebae]
MAKLIRYFSVSLFMISSLPAKDLCCHGELFPIAEESLLEVIKRRLLNMQESGALETYQKQLAEHAKKKALIPEPVKIQHTKISRTFYYDPTLTLSEDLKDHEGQVFAKKGDKANPLEIIPLTKELLFIDGEDEEHLNWALSRTFPSKIILIRGQPLKLEERHHRPFYFDQLGFLTGRLSIKQVPARVFQEGTRLKIEELNIHITRSSNHE